MYVELTYPNGNTTLVNIDGTERIDRDVARNLTTIYFGSGREINVKESLEEIRTSEHVNFGPAIYKDAAKKKAKPSEEKPDRTVQPPPFDKVTEGYDPDKE